MLFVNNVGYKVKTPSGWSYFDGIKKTTRNSTIKVVLDDQRTLETTHEHKLKLIDGTFEQVKNLLSASLDCGRKVVSLTEIDQKVEVFDLINVEKNHEYYTNDIVSSNCAFIRDFDTIWTGLSPTISTGGRAFILSTPNGVGGQFYKLWVDAEAGLNDFNPIKLPWQVHPEHDEAWFKKETKNLSRRKQAQEYLCSFLASGETFLNIDDLDWLRSHIKEPIEKRGFDNNVWLWALPQEGKRYVMPADIARGDSADFSAFHVIDADDGMVVAEYLGKAPPEKVGQMMEEFGKLYNDALAIPENNSFGYTTAMYLKEAGYPNLYYDHSKGDLFGGIKTSDKQVPGFSTQKKSRLNILTKFEELVRNKLISVHSARLVQQLQSFVWEHNKPQAMRDSHDDLIMSIAIGLYIVSSALQVDQVKLAQTTAMLSVSSKTSRNVEELPMLNEMQPSSLINQYTNVVSKREVINQRGRQLVGQKLNPMWSWLLK